MARFGTMWRRAAGRDTMLKRPQVKAHQCVSVAKCKKRIARFQQSDTAHSGAGEKVTHNMNVVGTKNLHQSRRNRH